MVEVSLFLKIPRDVHQSVKYKNWNQSIALIRIMRIPNDVYTFKNTPNTARPSGCLAASPNVGYFV